MGLGALVFATGSASCFSGFDIERLSTVLEIATLSSVALATGCIAVAWKRGHGEGRDLAISWAIPMAALAATRIIPFGGVLWGGGDKIVMLFAPAFQVACLTGLEKARLASLRRERDIAVETVSRMAELADRDALTGLLNRRGFLHRCSEDFGLEALVPFGLLVIDLDRFKLANHEFGHQSGDEALIVLGRTLRTFEKRFDCHVARLGGEEFVLGVSGLAGDERLRLGEEVRFEVARCDFRSISADLTITASIGIAHGMADGPFERLHRLADDALYAAKHSGRDRVVWSG